MHKLNITDYDFVKVRNLILIVNPLLRVYKGLRVNAVLYYHWCQTCFEGKQRAVYYCKTEGLYVCATCNGFCEHKAHNWEALSVDLQGKTTHSPVVN